jgi:PAS domain S-box-containing protein
MFDALDIGITVHEPDTGEILAVNTKLEELYGYTAAQLQEMTVADYTAPSTKYTQAEAVERIQQAASGEPQQFDWQIERSNGELRWVTVHLKRTTIDDIAVVVAEIQDITDQRARERRLRLLSRIVRHNLRNQMMVVTARAKRARESITDPTLDEQLSTVIDVAGDAGEMAEAVSQIEAIADPNGTQRSVTDLTALVESICTGAAETYPHADITLDVPSELLAVTDEGIEYALEQAIENAIEHNDRTEPTVEITVQAGEDDEKAMILITDDGPRIPAVEREVLDEMVETSSTYHGTGVGLWVMQWCINSLGGTLSFEANEPRGNIVTMTLPRRATELTGSENTTGDQSATVK